MQVADRVGFRFEVQAILDAVQVPFHEPGRVVAVALQNEAGQEAMLIHFAFVGLSRIVYGYDQERARDQFPHETGHDRTFRLIGQDLMVSAAAPDHPGRVARDARGFRALKMRLQGVAHRIVPPFGRSVDQVPLDNAPGPEHLPRLFHRRTRDEGAAIGNEFDDMIGRQPQQCGADAVSTDTEKVAKLVFFQVRPGQQLVIDDGVENVLLDLIRVHLFARRRAHGSIPRITFRAIVHSGSFPTVQKPVAHNMRAGHIQFRHH